MKKFLDATFSLGFTIAGSIVLYFTLSGTTQRVALFSTVTALIAHYWLVFKDKND